MDRHRYVVLLFVLMFLQSCGARYGTVDDGASLVVADVATNAEPPYPTPAPSPTPYLLALPFVTQQAGLLDISTGPASEWKFDTTILRTTSELPFQVRFSNAGSIAHSFVIDGPHGPQYAIPGPGADEFLAPGATVVGPFIQLPPGTYRFRCTVPAHDMQMQGQLTVANGAETK